MPVQRIPRYVLLLGQLFSCTPKHHPDKRPLGEALAKVRMVADELNEIKRDAESSTKVLTIQRKLTDRTLLQLYQPHRKYVMEGDLTVWVPNDKKNQGKARRCFLFNDLLLIAKAKKRDTLHSKKVLYTNSITVIDIDDDKENRNVFALSHGDENWSLKFKCDKPEDKFAWMKEITNSVAMRISLPLQESTLEQPSPRSPDAISDL